MKSLHDIVLIRRTPGSVLNRKYGRLLLLLLGAMLLLTACGREQTELERIQQRGELRIVTRLGPTTYFVGGNGPTGFEYDLAARFANSLGVKLSVVASDDLNAILQRLNDGRSDMAAAGLAITPERRKRFHFSPSYQDVSVKLVFKQGKFWPRSFDQLDGKLTVVAQSSHAELLLQAKARYPRLSWHETSVSAVEDLVAQVLNGTLDYTLLDSNDLALQRRYHPELAVAFTVAKKQSLAWAFRRNTDDSLYAAASEFLAQMRASQDLASLQDLYYGHLDKFDYVGSRRFLAAARTRLKKFEPLFKNAAKTSIDWRLLAAMGYQESHWNPRARSPTGVRGIMMLTRPTAQHLGVSNRLDPAQSIRGGALYLNRIRKRIPPRIGEPDRTWMALAAYNIGWGHLEDARIITQKLGGNPDKWLDVRESLPRLSQKKWYRHTRYGYARGDEPVRYVDNIRRYFEVLTWLYQNSTTRDSKATVVHSHNKNADAS